MKILWILDLEDGPVDPDELLGEISLEHNGVTLSYGPTFLDSWFRGLIDGYKQLQEGHERVEIDLLDEPHLLLFEATVKGVRISYHDSYIPSVSLKDFYHALLESATALVMKVETESDNRDFTLIRPIKEFIESR